MNKIPCRKSFTQTLLELAKKDKSIIAVATDSRGSVTLEDFANELPEQFVECGIAEQDAVGISAGLATCGKKPFVCSPASFLSTRSLEQVKVDVAYSHTNVKVIGISGGISYGALGMSHHSLQDIAVMRAIPGITVILPADEYQTREMTKALVDFDGPVYVRMGRGAVENIYNDDYAPFIIGKANVLTEGNDIAVIATGETVVEAYKAANELKDEIGINMRVIDMHTVKPLDEEVILKAAQDCKAIITVEEHSIYGGLGEAVAHVLIENKAVPMKIIGLPDESLVSGNSKEMYEYYGLNAKGIIKEAKELLNR